MINYPQERSCLYEDFVLHPVGEDDRKRRDVLKRVRECVDDFLKKNGKFGTMSDFFIKYSDDFCKHKQDYVNIVYHNQITGTATKVAATSLSFAPIPGAGIVASNAKNIQKSADEDSLGKYFHSNLTAIENKLRSTIRGWKFKVSSAANILEIEIKEQR